MFFQSPAGHTAGLSPFQRRMTADCVCSPSVGAGTVRMPPVSAVHFFDVSSQYDVTDAHS